MDDPSCNTTTSTPYNGGTFGFTANASFGGCFVYSNSLDTTITYVDVAFNNTAGFTEINCTSTSGFGCNPQFDANGVVELIFTLPVGTEFGGYVPGEPFSFNLNDPICVADDVESCSTNTDPNGAGGWKNPDNSPITFYFAASNTAVTPTVPEPASILLLGTSLGAMYFRRRRV